MKKTIATLPIKPQKNTNVGMLLAPVIMDFLGDVLDCNKTFAVNTLNSYNAKDLELPTYISSVLDSGIKYDNIVIDSLLADNIMQLVTEMVDKNIIKVSKEKLVRCACGKVDLLEAGLRKNSLGKLYSLDQNGDIICNCCKTKCETYNEEVLILPFSKENYKKINIVPNFLEKEANEAFNNLDESKLLISKARNTGYSISKDNKTYYIDIDFLWMNFANFLEGSPKILIACNHQLFKMLLMHYINSVTANQDLIFIAHPYLAINNLEEVNKLYFQNQDEYFRKLALLYQFRWNKKTCNLATTVIEYLNTMNSTKRMNMYKAMLEQSREILEKYKDKEECIYKILADGTNMQKNLVLAKSYAKRNG